MRKTVGVFLMFSTLVFGQQKMTLQEAEVAFKKNNLQLLAEQFNISQAQADIVQAKIWDLPQGEFTANLLKPEKGQVLDVGPSKSAQVSQLFQLGGKRKKQIDLLNSSKELAQLGYNQLVVDLLAQLRETFYSIYYDQQKIENIDKQLSFVTFLVDGYKAQVKKGNVSLKDEVRLNSMAIGLKNDRVQLINEITTEQATMKVLTGLSVDILPVVEEQNIQGQLQQQPLLSLDAMKSTALNKNADYLSALASVDNAKKMVVVQKSLNVPDLTGGIQWNQKSGIYPNEINFVVGIPIPLWKQNAGNIQKAQFGVQQNQANADFKKVNLETQVTAAYQTWNSQYLQLKEIPNQDVDNLNTVYNGMIDNFKRGNVSLIDFTDFMDSYKQTVLQISEIKKQVLISAEELTRLVQTTIF